MDKYCDTFFFVCMDRSKPWKNVERVYVIPKDIVIKRSSITIYKNPSRSAWYEDFRIDERPFNDVYHNMSLGNCKVLKKRMD